MSDSATIIIDLIANAIYEANDAEMFDLEDNAVEGQDPLAWYRREAVQVLEALREAGVDIVGLYDAVVNPPQPPVSLVPRRLPKVIVRADGEVYPAAPSFDDAGGLLDPTAKLFGGTDD